MCKEFPVVLVTCTKCVKESNLLHHICHDKYEKDHCVDCGLDYICRICLDKEIYDETKEEI